MLGRTLILLFYFYIIGYSKIAYKSFVMEKGKEWQYFTKFGTDIIESGTYKMQGRFKTPFASDRHYSINVYFYFENQWDIALATENCKDKLIKYARRDVIDLNPNGSWSNISKARLRDASRPHVWFIAIEDCDNTLHVSHPELPPIQLSIRLLNTGDTHFTYDEYYILPLYAFTFVCYGLLLGYIIYDYFNDYLNNQRSDNPILLLLSAVVSQFLAIAFMLIHLIRYSYNGEGYILCHGFSVILETASQFLISVLLILMSWGWTIIYVKLGRTELFVQLLLTLLIIHLLLAGFTELGSDEYYTYHNYDRIQGILLVVLRLLMFGWFVYGSRKTYDQCNLKIRQFLTTFSIYSGLYLLSFPILVLVSKLCMAYSRKRVITFGTIFIQSVTIYSLLKLLTGKNEYTKMSRQNAPLLSLSKSE